MKLNQRARRRPIPDKFPRICSLSQVNFGFSYTLVEDIFVEPLGDGFLIEREFADRTFVTPVAIRMGVTDSVQLSASFPFGLSFLEIEDFIDSDRTRRYTTGDFAFGLTDDAITSSLSLVVTRSF